MDRGVKADMLVALLIYGHCCVQGPTDSELLGRLRSEWIGKRVWVLGAAAYAKKTWIEVWSPMLSAKVLDLERNDSPISSDSPVAWPGENAYDAIPGTTYRVVLALPKMKVHRVPNGSTQDGPVYYPPFFGEVESTWTYTTKDGKVHNPLKESAGLKPATEGWIQFDNEDQVKRQITVLDPEVLLRKEPRRIRSAFTKHHVVKGMTRAMVARIIGFPSMKTPLEEIWRADSWEYPGMTPFATLFTFNKKGRLTRAEVTGSLP